jgi:predicted nucleic acid-binding OB-fold protein
VPTAEAAEAFFNAGEMNSSSLAIKIEQLELEKYVGKHHLCGILETRCFTQDCALIHQ